MKLIKNKAKPDALRCPFCGSDHVHTVTDMATKEESYFCLSCEMEFGELDQILEED